MIRPAAVLLTALTLAACNREPSVNIRTDDGTRVSVGGDGADIATDNGAVALRTEGDQVSVKLPGVAAQVTVPGMKLDTGDMDIDGMKVHPGTKLAGLSADGADGRGEVRLNFTDPASPGEVAAYYRQAAPAAGYRMEAGTDARVAGTKAGKRFEILLYPGDGGTRGTIRITDGG